jgi:catechol 2,3-dioxygenase-like lactoylglutathione lyase family enzyme
VSLVTHLAHVALRMPDPDAAAVFYQHALGLGVTGRGPDGAIRLSCRPPHAAVVAHHEVVLYPGQPAEVDHVGFGVPDEEALEAAARALRRRGQVVEGPRTVETVHGPAVRLRDPDGMVVELLVPPAPVLRPGGDAEVGLLRLGHITRRSPDPPRAARWWQEVLGFRLSDAMGEEFFWLRCNRDHHTVGVVRGQRPGTHHLAVEAGAWDDLRRLGDHLAAQGVAVEFGPGRHGPGHNLFMYLRDPWGLRWEVFCEMMRIDEEAHYRPGRWEPARRMATVNRWGPPPPPTFLADEGGTCRG